MKEMFLSDQALGALMMALQKSLLEQSDITNILGDLIFLEKDGELVCKNPPLVKFEQNTVEDDYDDNEF